MWNFLSLFFCLKILSGVYISDGLIRLGIIESSSTLIDLCQDALFDAKISNNCVDDQIE